MAILILVQVIENIVSCIPFGVQNSSREELLGKLKLYDNGVQLLREKLNSKVKQMIKAKWNKIDLDAKNNCPPYCQIKV